MLSQRERERERERERVAGVRQKAVHININEPLVWLHFEYVSVLILLWWFLFRSMNSSHLSLRDICGWLQASLWRIFGDHVNWRSLQSTENVYFRDSKLQRWEMMQYPSCRLLLIKVLGRGQATVDWLPLHTNMDSQGFKGCIWKNNSPDFAEHMGFNAHQVAAG